MLRAMGAALRVSPGRRVQPGRLSRPRILLIRPDHLGDVLMATPAVEALRRSLPGARLEMMVGPWAGDLARRDPLLDEVLVCPFPGFTRSGRGGALAPYYLLWRTAGELRQRRYDAALILRFDHWWGAWLAALAGIPLRLGYGVPECAPFLTHPLPPPGRVHWVEQGLVLARLMAGMSGAEPDLRATPPGLRFEPSPEEEAEAEGLWQTLDLGESGPVAAIHPGAGAPIKLWPEAGWVVVGRALAERGLALLVTGSPGEAETAARIAAGIPGARSLAGRTGFGALGALFRRCRLVAGADNGALHMAAAVDVPSVALFGPSDPAVYGPWGDELRHRVVASRWPTAPCGRLDLPVPAGGYAECMEAISPERVIQECLALLADTASGT